MHTLRPWGEEWKAVLKTVDCVMPQPEPNVFGSGEVSHELSLLGLRVRDRRPATCLFGGGTGAVEGREVAGL